MPCHHVPFGRCPTTPCEYSRAVGLRVGTVRLGTQSPAVQKDQEHKALEL